MTINTQVKFVISGILQLRMKWKKKSIFYLQQQEQRRINKLYFSKHLYFERSSGRFEL